MTQTAESYRAYWAVLTGKSPREIYVPAALREEPAPVPEEEPHGVVRSVS